jgi:hypothetical protein
LTHPGPPATLSALMSLRDEERMARTHAEILRTLLDRHGRTFADEMGIDVAPGGARGGGWGARGGGGVGGRPPRPRRPGGGG